ncbi:ThuA domain-containing protein [Microbacterium sp. G2-8]|uniref:ThuA domain-containing protein n=1 Tax=Microbacterium sp. G2-8 TaxID=2842454 RepID=UPI001C899E86|nr:ThuA domain-containing protein [Microbacterium sp. G2-8]
MRAIIAAGTGRYADPWHPFVETSGLIAEVLGEDGWDAVVDDDVDRALTRLEDANLLVVDAGDPWRNGETGRGAPDASVAGLDAALARGIGVLAVHNAVSSLRDYPAWRAAIGGEWIVGRSGHPPIGAATFAIVRPDHPVTADIGDLRVFDERYAHLDVDDEADVLATSDVDGEAQPAVWALTREEGRAVVSTLGHDARAFRAESHRALLQAAARWATA